MELEYLNDLLVDLEEDETLQIAGGEVGSTMGVSSIIIGVVLSLFICAYCVTKVYAPSIDSPCPYCGGPLSEYNGGSGC